MQSTANAGLPYPDLGDSVAGLATIGQALAEGIARKVALPLVAQAGWSIQAQNCYAILGDLALWFDIDITRTGADITPPASGNIGDNDICLVNDLAYAPARTQLFPIHRSTVGMWQGAYSAATRMIMLTSGSGGMTWATGLTGQIHGLALLK